MSKKEKLEKILELYNNGIRDILDVFLFLNYIYKNASIYMDRKYKLAMQCIDELPNRGRINVAV